MKGALKPPKIEMRGFGHLQYDYSRFDQEDATKSDTNHFTVGGVDLFLSSKLSDRVSFLNETIFEFGQGGENILDVERVLLKYDLDKKFNVSIGRGHTALGYWNQRFHHGTWLATTINRPRIYDWEDDGGFLPVHYVGLEFNGLFDVPGGNLSYVSHIANGRGKITDEVSLIEDRNDSKMLSTMLTYEPEAVEGLGFGANILYDVIPDNPDLASRSAEIDELIYGAHLFYTMDPYEFIMETEILEHDHHNSILDDTTIGGYAQLAYRVNKYKPYFRFDWLRAADRDPFLAGLVEDESSYTAGIRYELATWNAIKLEYRFVDADTAQKNEAAIQTSFAF
jgi:hypothetical protein